MYAKLAEINKIKNKCGWYNNVEKKSSPLLKEVKA